MNRHEEIAVCIDCPKRFIALAINRALEDTTDPIERNIAAYTKRQIEEGNCDKPLINQYPAEDAASCGDRFVKECGNKNMSFVAGHLPLIPIPVSDCHS
jgi:hypothetical protein